MAESFIVVIIICACVWVFWLRRKPFQPPQTRAATQATFSAFRAAESLFVNRSERLFFHRLQNHLPRGYYVQSKVRLEDIIRVKPEIKHPKQRWMLRGRVKSRHVDFLIIDQEGRPCLAIELDGPSHDHHQATHADDLKTGLFQACYIPFHRVRVGEDFNSRISTIFKTLS